MFIEATHEPPRAFERLKQAKVADFHSGLQDRQTCGARRECQLKFTLKVIM
jgi:hypothetical protein